MKKFISILLAALLLFSFTSCGKEEEEHITQTEDVTTLHEQEFTENYDIGIKDVRFNNSTIRAGYPVDFKIKLENLSKAPIKDFNIALYDELDNEISNTSYKEEVIKPGNIQEIKFTIAMPSNFTPCNGYFKVILNKQLDVNDANDTFNVRLSYEDISIENVEVIKGKNNKIEILGTVVNQGYGTPSKLIIELRKDNEEGVIIDTVIIDTPLKRYDFKPFQFTLEDTNYTRYCVALSKDSITDGNMNLLNDLAYTYSK